MPLDVKPLSLTRRIVMILLMLAFLGGSLGFAQWLIDRQPLPDVPKVIFVLPEGVDSLPVITALNGALTPGTWTGPAGPRNVYAFNLDTDNSPTAAYLQVLLDRILPDPEAHNLVVEVVDLDGYPAWQSLRQVQHQDGFAFAIIRLAPVSDHIVAFCLSGKGPFTDADRRFFDDYCAQQILIHLDNPRKG